ncbi:MAG: metalloregulator ArsR/SmtB family transcription factor [Burkholderiales bacterium]|nr:metalloregulator ArsR/SmtB family transcription factor [Burkholderiales bacterium]
MNDRFQPAGEAQALGVLSALAQPSRLRIFRALVGAGPVGLHPGQIGDALRIPGNALSFHLRALHGSGLVSLQREGRFLRYRANLGAMQELLQFLTANCCGGEPCAGSNHSITVETRP